MIEKGYDTDYDDVSAWSTLGWFKDPVLSNMLYRGKGQIAELIIHEMTHATLYLKSNVDINENLASVCGEQGAIKFLQSTFGDSSSELKNYLERKEDYDQFSAHMLAGTAALDSLYSLYNDSLTILKMKVKKKMISQIVASLDTVKFHNEKRHKNLFSEAMPNNAYLLNFVRYDSQKNKMKNILSENFHDNIRAFIDHIRETGGKEFIPEN
jgi:predicted aminopeptidase